MTQYTNTSLARMIKKDIFALSVILCYLDMTNKGVTSHSATDDQFVQAAKRNKANAGRVQHKASKSPE